MYQNFFLSSLLLLAAFFAGAQTYKVNGSVTTTKLEPLAFASIQVKEQQWGTVTKEGGTFTLNLNEGRYTIVISMIGYKTQVVNMVVNKDMALHVILEEEEGVQLSDVMVSGNRKDQAEEIIRQVIRHKENIAAAAGAWSCIVYIRASQQDSAAKQTRKKITDTARAKNANADLNGMSLSEIYLNLDHASPQQVKETRTGVKKIGRTTGLFYQSTTEGTFDFYSNLVKVPALSALSFLSPVSYSGLMAYRFKTLKVQKSGAHKIYTIGVKPRQLSNATVAGELTISDSAWVLLQTRFVFPSYHLPEYDFFEVAQQYSLVNNQAWLLSAQTFTYQAKGGGHTLSGQTVVTYKDYEINKKFGKNYFGNEISTTAKEAYEQDSTFWQTVRTVPLTQKELRFIRYRDSVYRAMHTAAYLDSIDKITNKVTWKKLTITGQSFYNRSKQRTWNLPPILSLYQPVAFGGGRFNASVYFSKVYASKKYISVATRLSYGFRNTDVTGSIALHRMYNPFNRGSYHITAGRDFQFIYEGDAWINMLKRNNYFLNNYAGIGHSLELTNGLFLYSDLDVALRHSVSTYKTGTAVDSLLRNVFTDNHAVAFEPYQAVYGKIRLQYTPKQRYLREPREKIILGSAWPTFYASWRKGVPGIFNSKVDFDYLEMGVEQQLNLGLLGITRYNVRTGSFLNQKDLKLIDYKFQRRGDPLLFLNPDEQFQALDSTFPVFKRFYQAHLVHEFNGAFINKVPLLKKLQLREVAGFGFLYAPERSLRYVETFIGLERVFKWPFSPLSKFKIGVYGVGAAANQFAHPLRFKVGITKWDRDRNKWF